jgi:serine/threonine protein kinase
LNQKGNKLSENRIKKFIVEMILAVEYMHSQEIIHRDLKPSNIFLKGKDYTIQIGDFGIAAQNRGAAIVEDVGTLAYQAPEMFDGSSYDYKTDIWSLGCVIFAMCNFSHAFDA